MTVINSGGSCFRIAFVSRVDLNAIFVSLTGYYGRQGGAGAAGSAGGAPDGTEEAARAAHARWQGKVRKE